MPLEVTIHLHDTRWKTALRPYCKTVRMVCESVPRARGAVAVVLADDAMIAQLNDQFRGKNKPTNVLSFPNDDEPLGDIVLAYDTIAQEAAAQQKTFRHHAIHLIVHGMLHLLGYDHEAAHEAKKMEALEIKALKKMGIANPYL